jgi:hypothetical protein
VLPETLQVAPEVFVLTAHEYVPLPLPPLTVTLVPRALPASA